MAYQGEICTTCDGTGWLLVPTGYTFIPGPDMSPPAPSYRICTDCNSTGRVFDEEDDDDDDDDERSFDDDED
jgi:hypothetical protein